MPIAEGNRAYTNERVKVTEIIIHAQYLVAEFVSV